MHSKQIWVIFPPESLVDFFSRLWLFWGLVKLLLQILFCDTFHLFREPSRIVDCVNTCRWEEQVYGIRNAKSSQSCVPIIIRQRSRASYLQLPSIHTLFCFFGVPCTKRLPCSRSMPNNIAKREKQFNTGYNQSLESIEEQNEMLPDLVW